MSRLICVFLIVYLQNGIFGGVIKSAKEDYMPSFTLPPKPDMKKDGGDQKSEDYMPPFELPQPENDGDNIIVPPKPDDKKDDSDQKSKDYMPSFTVPPNPDMKKDGGDKKSKDYMPAFTLPPSKDDGDKVPDLPSFTVPPQKPGMDDEDKTEDKDSKVGTGDEDVVIEMEVDDDGDDDEEDDGVDMYGPPPIPNDEGESDDDDDEDDEDDEVDLVKPWGWNDKSTGPNYYKGKKSGSKIEIEARLALPVQVGDSLGADSFNSKSCLRIAVEDVSLQDVASVVHFEVYRRNVSTSPEPHLIKLDYTPFRFPFGYKVSAVLNRNWCGQGNNDEWVREGDFLTTANFGIKTTNEKNKFIADIVLEEYDR